MKKNVTLALLLLSCGIGAMAPLHALRKKKDFCSEEEAEAFAEKHFNRGCHFYNNEDWRLAMNEFEKVLYFVPDSEIAPDTYYYLGICFYEKHEFDFANEAFTEHLKASAQPAFFEDALEYKFCIAEHFRLGKKRRPFTYRYFPRWTCGKSMALSIYDEIVLVLPNQPLTVRALFSKALLLQEMKEYRQAIETFQTIIRRFPNDEIVPECYLKISQSYAFMSLYEFQNPDILALAQLNAHRFELDFPRDDRIVRSWLYVQKIKEIYARGLSNLGEYYERRGHPAAAGIYYQSSIEEFPDTDVADFSRCRLEALGLLVDEEEEPEPVMPQEVLPIEVVPPGGPTLEVNTQPIEIADAGWEMPAQVDPEGATFVHYSLLKSRPVRRCPTFLEE